MAEESAYQFSGDIILNFGDSVDSIKGFNKETANMARTFGALGNVIEKAAIQVNFAMTRIISSFVDLAKDIKVVVDNNNSLIKSFQAVAVGAKDAAEAVNAYSKALSGSVNSNKIAQGTFNNLFKNVASDAKQAQDAVAKIGDTLDSVGKKGKIDVYASGGNRGGVDRGQYSQQRNQSFFLRALLGNQLLSQVKGFEDSAIDATEKNEAFKNSLGSLGYTADQTASYLAKAQKYARAGIKFDDLEGTIAQLAKVNAPIEETLDRIAKLTLISGKSSTKSASELFQNLYSDNPRIGRQLQTQFKLGLDTFRQQGLVNDVNQVIVRGPQDRNPLLQGIDQGITNKGGTDILERSNTSLAGSFTALQATIEQAKISLGDHFAPAVQQVNSVLSNLIQTISNNSTDSEKGFLGFFVVAAGGAAQLTQVLAPLVYTVTTLANALKGTALAAFASELLVAAQAGSVFKDLALTSSFALFETLGTSISAAVLPVGALVAAFVALSAGTLVVIHYILQYNEAVSKGSDLQEDLSKRLKDEVKDWQEMAIAINSGTDAYNNWLNKHGNKGKEIAGEDYLQSQFDKGYDNGDSQEDLVKNLDVMRKDALAKQTAAEKSGSQGQLLANSGYLEQVARNYQKISEDEKEAYRDARFNRFSDQQAAKRGDKAADDRLFTDKATEEQAYAVYKPFKDIIEQLLSQASKNREPVNLLRGSEGSGGDLGTSVFNVAGGGMTTQELQSAVKELNKEFSRGKLTAQEALVETNRLLHAAKKMQNVNTELNKLEDERVKLIKSAHKERLDEIKDQQSLLSSLGKLTPDRQEQLNQRKIASVNQAIKERGYSTTEDRKELREAGNTELVLAHEREVIRKESVAKIIGIEQGKYAQQTAEEWKFVAELRKAGYEEVTIAKLVADRRVQIAAQSRLERLKYEQSIRGADYASNLENKGIAKSQIDEAIREGQGDVEDAVNYGGKSLTGNQARKALRGDTAKTEINQIESEKYFKIENLKEQANLDPIAAKYLDRDIAVVIRKATDDEAKIREAVRTEDIKQDQEDAKIVRDAAIRANQIKAEILNNRNTRISDNIKSGTNTITSKALSADEMQRQADQYFKNSKEETTSRIGELTDKRDNDLVNASPAQAANIEKQYQEDIAQLRLKQLDAVKSMTDEITKQKAKENEGKSPLGAFTMGGTYNSLKEAMDADNTGGGFGTLDERKKRLDEESAQADLKRNQALAGVDTGALRTSFNNGISDPNNNVALQMATFNKNNVDENGMWKAYNPDSPNNPKRSGMNIGSTIAADLQLKKDGVDLSRASFNRKHAATPANKDAFKLEGEITMKLELNGKTYDQKGKATFTRPQTNPDIPAGRKGFGN